MMETLAGSNNLSFGSNVDMEALIYNYSSSQSPPKVVKQEEVPNGQLLAKPNHGIIQAEVSDTRVA